MGDGSGFQATWRASLLGALLLALPTLAAAEQTVGLFLHESRSFPGYTLFTPINSRFTYLIDNNGLEVNTWESDFTPGQSVYLLENGRLLRTARHDPGGTSRLNGGGAGGRVEEWSWDGRLEWEFYYSTPEARQHHDVEKLPNGNLLLIAWEFRSGAEAIATGRDPWLLADGVLWSETIIEVEPIGPAGADWLHFNSIDYNPGFDQILVSVHRFDEIWVIDHSTTTEQATGHAGGRYGYGGDLLYRWGNPRAWRAGTPVDYRLFRQHDAQWIEPGRVGAGKILVFNNGFGRPEGKFSTVEEWRPPVDAKGRYHRESGEPFGPAGSGWTYTAPIPFDLFSRFISGAERLPNGHTLICDGLSGHFFEVTRGGRIVWSYVNPVNALGPVFQGEIPVGNRVFRTRRYATDFPGLAGRDLTPGGPIEREP